MQSQGGSKTAHQVSYDPMITLLSRPSSMPPPHTHARTRSLTHTRRLRGGLRCEPPHAATAWLPRPQSTECVVTTPKYSPATEPQQPSWRRPEGGSGQMVVRDPRTGSGTHLGIPGTSPPPPWWAEGEERQGRSYGRWRGS